MSRFLIACSAFFLCGTATIHAQTWMRTYGGTRNDIGYCVQQTDDGGYVVVGGTKSYGQGSDDVWLVKTDSLGDVLWTNTFGGADLDCGHSVRQTSVGGYIIAGWTHSYGAGSSDVWLIRTDALGDRLWAKTFGGTEYDCGYSVQQTADGGFIVAGCTGSYGAGLRDLWLIKTDSAGDTLWTKTHGGTSTEVAYSVQQTWDGGYAATGYVYNRDYDLWLLRTDSLGNALWARTFDIGYYDMGRCVRQTSDGGFIVAGWTGFTDVLLVKTDAYGNSLWTKVFGGAYYDNGYSVQQTLDGGYILTGSTYSFGPGSDDVWLIKTDSLGDTIWTKTFGGPAQEWGYSVQQTTNGGYIVAGQTHSYGAGWGDVWLIKTDSLGNVGIEEESARSQFPNPKSELKCYPNPASRVVRVSFPHADIGEASFSLYDTAGRKVKKIRSIGAVIRISLDLGDLEPGTYFVRLKAGADGMTEKLVVLK